MRLCKQSIVQPRVGSDQLVADPRICQPHITAQVNVGRARIIITYGTWGAITYGSFGKIRY